MKKTIFEIISDLQKDINNTKSKERNYIPEDVLEKYNNFKKWLDENGALYPRVSFPQKFANIIGCEATEDIKENNCIFYIP